MRLPNHCCSVCSGASAACVSQMKPSRCDYSLRRRREGVKAVRDFGVQSSRSPGNKCKCAHVIAQLSLYFALLQDAECSLSKVRTLVFIYRHPTSVSPPQFSQLRVHPHKTAFQIAKTCFWGPVSLIQTPRCCTAQGATLCPAAETKGQLATTPEHPVGHDAGWEAQDAPDLH